MFGFLKKLFGKTQDTVTEVPYKIETPATATPEPVVAEEKPKAETKAKRARKPRAAKAVKK
jgi:hypothetical protein